MAETYLLDKLKSIEQTFNELTDRLADPDIANNPEELLKVAEAHYSLKETVVAYREWQQAKEELASVRQIVADPVEDPELKELAIAEITELETKISRLTKQLLILLLPQNPLDRKSVFLEITANEDREESFVWVGNLLQMYSRYGESQLYSRYRENEHWRVVLVGEYLGERKGFKQAILALEGDGVYGKLKFETGIHQLKTDSQETDKSLASATITVIPQVDLVEMPISPEEIKEIRLYSGPSVIKLIGVQILHQPTGIRVTCTEERSYFLNRERAIEILRAKLYDIKLVEQQKEVPGLRLSQVGTEARSEKIRTYNYKDNCITDHRLGQNFPLAGSLEGDIETMIQSCISQDQQQRLEELANSPDTAEALQ